MYRDLNIPTSAPTATASESTRLAIRQIRSEAYDAVVVLNSLASFPGPGSAENLLSHIDTMLECVTGSVEELARREVPSFMECLALLRMEAYRLWKRIERDPVPTNADVRLDIAFVAGSAYRILADVCELYRKYPF